MIESPSQLANPGFPLWCEYTPQNIRLESYSELRSPTPAPSRPGSRRRRFQRHGVCVRERSLLHPQNPKRLAHALRQDERFEQLRAAKTLGFRLAIREDIRKLIRLTH